MSRGHGRIRPYLAWTACGMALAAIAMLLGSFFVSGGSVAVLGAGAIGPLSSSPGAPVATSGPRQFDSAVIRFDFQAGELVTGQVVFRLGTVGAGLVATVSGAVEGQRYILLSQSSPGHQSVRLVLINHVQPRVRYEAMLAVTNRSTITTTVGGERQSSYHLPTSLPAGALSQVSVGQGSLPATNFNGAVDQFRARYVQFGPKPSDTSRLVLRLVAALDLAALFVLAIIWTAISLSGFRRRSGLGADPHRVQGLYRALRAHCLLFGVLAIAVGVVVLCVVTPTDNTVLQPDGGQLLRSGGVGSSGATSYAMADEPALMSQAAAVDMEISFLIERIGTVPQTPLQSGLVSTSNGHQGVKFDLTSRGVLVGTLYGAPGLLPVANYPIVSYLPADRWVAIDLTVLRSQSYSFRVDGMPLQAFTWALPIVRPVPVKLSVTTPSWVAVKHVVLRVSTLVPPANGNLATRIRLLQILAIGLVIGGVLLISRRLFRRLIPKADDASLPLVRTIFATAGAATLVNIGVDLMHFQHSQITYYERNTWLLSRYPRFTDFFQAVDLLRSLNPYGIQGGNYPPFGYLLVAPFVWVNEYAGLLVYLSLAIGFIIWWSARCFTTGLPVAERIGVVLVVLFSLPVTFAIDRANLDLVIFALVIFGIAAYERERNTLSAVWIGLAAAAKGFPAIYLLLFIPRKRLKYLAVALLVGIVATMAALLSFHGSLAQNIDGFRAAERSLQNYFKQSVDASTYFNASIVGWTQAIGYTLNGSVGALSVQHAFAPFILPMDVISGLFVLWFVTRKGAALWRAVSIMTIAILLFAQIANYYELLLLFVPISLFVRNRRADSRSIAIAVLFGLLLAPKAYFYFGGFVEFSVLVTAPLLMVLGGLIVADELRSPLRNPGRSVSTSQRADQDLLAVNA